MPAKNVTKQYIENGYYHIYNRGVEKRSIFLDQQDYGVFLSYLKEYLLPKEEKALFDIISNPIASPQEKNKARKLLRLNNFANEITLLAYCLMPNHFHFFIKQSSSGSIDAFMQSVCTRYTMYFNKKYKRVGSLYQGVYKAVLVTEEIHFIYLSKYIHKQAIALQGETLHGEGQPCSYPEYLGHRTTQWIKPEEVLNYFSRSNSTLSYEAFVSEKENDHTLTQDVLIDDCF